ncbi:MAG: hypothetical protein QG577_2723 [Thermodesulfobacteriota bacterium]|nr:hypothetical protein [Thermodesulfobacteriota bacterium]
MRIRLAKTAGFCMGVRRAVETVLDLQRYTPPLPIVTYGPLIHNPQTLTLLASRGIREVASLDDINGGTVIIRAHGISPQEREELIKRADLVVDATCPRVAKVQAIIKKHAAAGDLCVIVGDSDHPEVKGLMGFAVAGGIAIPNSNSLDQLDIVPTDRKICLVVQTTQELDNFEAVSQAIRNRFSHVRVYNTICDSTTKRQTEVAQLASNVDLVVVVGGRGSGNTQRLVKVSQSQGTRTLHLETDEELSPELLRDVHTVGITAGASTPNWLILSVIDKIKEIGLSRKKGLSPTVRKLGDVVVMTYVWAALSGASLTAACLALQGKPITILPPAVTALFVFSMHLFNRIHDSSGAVRFNTPQIAAFYAQHRGLLTVLAGASSILGIFLSYGLGTYSFFLLITMIGAGGIYTTQLLPPQTLPSLKWRSLKDLPGSKTPLVAIGWGMSAAVVPVIGSDHFSWEPAVTVSFLFASGLVFCRTALSDLLDIQGDRIVGRGTIPIKIGVSSTGKLLTALLLMLAIGLVVSSLSGWVSQAAYLFVVNILILGGILAIYKKRHPVDRLVLEALIDGNFVLAGLMALWYAH